MCYAIHSTTYIQISVNLPARKQLKNITVIGHRKVMGAFYLFIAVFFATQNIDGAIELLVLL
jgi:hypothetical protein